MERACVSRFQPRAKGNPPRERMYSRNSRSSTEPELLGGCSGFLVSSREVAKQAFLIPSCFGISTPAARAASPRCFPQRPSPPLRVNVSQSPSPCLHIFLPGICQAKRRFLAHGSKCWLVGVVGAPGPLRLPEREPGAFRSVGTHSLFVAVAVLRAFPEGAFPEVDGRPDERSPDFTASREPARSMLPYLLRILCSN